MVLRVIPAGDMPCVDLSLGNEEHLYWTNGLLTHNSTNFALCYGGGGNAVVRATGCDKNEGWRIKNQFDATYKGLRSWWVGQHQFANKYGFVLTAWGRIYPVPDIWSADGGFRSKAERNSVNGPIQGCLHGDSRVPTSLGVRRIEDLSGKSFNVWTGTHWAKGRAFPSGLKHLMQTALTSGLVMQTSPDHRFRVYGDGGLTWVRQEDLTPEMWVVTDAVGADLPEQSLAFMDGGEGVHNKKGFSFTGNHEALWELLGLVIGDGSIRDDGIIIHVGGPDAEQQARFYADRFARALNLSSTVKEKIRSKGEDRLPTWQVCFWNTAFRGFCRTLGLGDWNTYTKRVPEAVWSQSARHRAAFLRGYLSADGCVNVAEAVDVRSTNPDLLMDTHKLLRSIGIRSTVRLDSKRVSIKDRVSFRERVGFLVSGKTDRLASINPNPWTGQWHALPQGLIQKIGDVVYNSSIYAALPRAEKSAVLRLKAGSGSKPQCLRYLTKLPAQEVPALITSLLGFDYEQVVRVVDPGASVEMYDIEVFDAVHAFVCDGVVVHNSGADIIKIGMGIVYKEVKKRGWTDLVKLTASMHDELVFEIHGSVLEEAINVITPLMTSNPLISGMKWPVPLTTDCEIGPNWMVPWAYNEMVAREVKFEGNKKVKEPKKPLRDDPKYRDDPEKYERDMAEYPAKKAAWQAMLHSWPEDLRPLFTVCQQDGGVSTSPPSPRPTAPSPALLESPPLAENPPVVMQVPELSLQDEVETPAPQVASKTYLPTVSQDTCYFTLRSPLTPGVCSKLAEAICDPQVRGTKKLCLKLPDGTVLSGWADRDHYVNPFGFHFLASRLGLQID